MACRTGHFNAEQRRYSARSQFRQTMLSRGLKLCGKPRARRTSLGVWCLSWEAWHASLDTSTLKSRTAANLWSKPWAETGWQYFRWLGTESLTRAAYHEEVILRSLACCTGHTTAE